MKGKTKKLKIFGWIGLAVAVLTSFVALTFSWFSDKKGADISITISTTSGNAQVTNALDPKDLIAGNYFVKNISVNLVSKEDVYLRTYAVVSMQTLDSAGQTVNKTDVVLNTGVNSSIRGEDNKFYYSTTNANSLTGVKNTTLNLTFAFYVSPKINDEVLRNPDGTLKTDLKTTITYYVDYCQVGGEGEWQNLSTDKTSYLITWKNADNKILKIDFTPYGTTPTYLPAPTQESTSTTEYVFSAWSPAVAQVSASAEYTANYNEVNFVAEFPSAWKDEIASKGLTSISSATDITGMRFDSPKTVPSEYQNTGKTLSTGIRIYQSTSNPTEIAFVYGTINAPASKTCLFSDSA
ncbi:MAG: hypothetical protein ACI4TI_02025, partial [Christensenellales bacterium]